MGCSPGSAALPLTLYVETVADALEESIVLALENPTNSRIFVPVAWTGIAVFQQLATGSWAEYHYPDKFQPMQTTTNGMIMYSIPPGTLEPGSYKLVIQGRIGSDGTPFSLEANINIEPGHEASNQ